MSNDKIDNFSQDFEFLSNRYPCNIEFDGDIYSSLEHAFQAAKTSDVQEREKIKNTPSGADAKKIGRHVTMISDWDNKKLDVMADLVRQKFSNNLDLKIKLLMTGSKELVQGGMWKADFWGVDKNGSGENQLGKVLMRVRDAIRAQEGGPEAVFSAYVTKNGLGFMADSVKSLRESARKLVDVQKLAGQASTELSALEEVLKVLE